MTSFRNSPNMILTVSSCRHHSRRSLRATARCDHAIPLGPPPPPLSQRVGVVSTSSHRRRRRSAHTHPHAAGRSSGRIDRDDDTSKRAVDPISPISSSKTLEHRRLAQVPERGHVLRLLERLVICEVALPHCRAFSSSTPPSSNLNFSSLRTDALGPRHHSRGPAVVLVLHEASLACAPARHCMPGLAVRGLPGTCWGCFVVCGGGSRRSLLVGVHRLPRCSTIL